MDNSTMEANRFYRWAKARHKHRLIVQHLHSGGKVVIATYTHATVYTQQHADIFKATKSGLYVRARKRWDCLDFSTIKLVT